MIEQTLKAKVLLLYNNMEFGSGLVYFALLQPLPNSPSLYVLNVPLLSRLLGFLNEKPAESLLFYRLRNVHAVGCGHSPCREMTLYVQIWLLVNFKGGHQCEIL